MRVSVIVPVRNNAHGLTLCLNALRQQSYPREEFEIIVVDNGSTDDIAAVKSRFPEVRWFYEEGASSYAARNRGLQETRGEIVAFTDSDCRPAPMWIENGVRALDTKRGTIIGGNIAMIDPVGRELNAVELLEIVASGLPDSRYLVEVRGFTPTGNLITFRSTFEHWGFFDATLKSAGDREWVTRAVKQGEKLLYAEDVVVMHPRRSTFRELARKYRRQVGGRMILLKRSNPLWIAILRELFLYSVFDPRIYAAGLFMPRPMGLLRRLQLVGMIILMSCVTTFERFKVYLGGQASRG